MSEDGYGSDRIEEMKQRFVSEREKFGYSINDPVEPIKNKSGIGRVILSVFIMIVIVAVCAIAVAVLASRNAGSPIDLSFLW